MAARVTQIDDGEITGNHSVPRGKRPWERSHRRGKQNIPNGRQQHQGRAQDRWHDAALQMRNQQPRFRHGSHSGAAQNQSRFDDRATRSSSIPRYAQGNRGPVLDNGGPRRPSQERNGNGDPLAASSHSVPSLHSRTGDATLNNRWIPPTKNREKESSLNTNNKNDESRVGVSGGEFTSGDKNSESRRESMLESKDTRPELKAVIKMGLNYEAKNEATTHVPVTSIRDTLTLGHSQNGKNSSQVKATTKVDDKISKWLSQPKVRTIHNHSNKQEDPFLVTSRNHERKGVADQSKSALVDRKVLKASKQIDGMAKELPAKNVDKALLFDTSTAGLSKSSPSMVSDDGPYATEASFSSYKSDQSLVVHNSTLSKWPRPSVGNGTADWSPAPAISTIHVNNVTKSGGSGDRIVCQGPTMEKSEAAVDNDSSSDSETDEEEVLLWAEKMFGVTPPGLRKMRQQHAGESDDESSGVVGTDDKVDSMAPPASMLRKDPDPHWRKQDFGVKRQASRDLEEEERKAAEEGKRKKEEAKPLTAAEIRAILDEDFEVAPSSHWVRRSSRQPCKAALQTPGVRALLDKLRRDDSDMVVLKMKKYVNNPDTPQVVIDAVLDALEENTNCEALYIQNFNRGMHDEQVLHLLKVLKLRTCKIWCLNIGETYNVKSSTWKKFARGLRDTNVTHMYASEHTIDGDLKDKIREIIRLNRKKHDMHCNPENLDVIVQCTHCWWNPINARVLRPYIRSKGYEHILKDKEAQGLRGTMSGATLGVDGA